jgi:hypothetical protein
MKYPFEIEHAKGWARFENLAQALNCALVCARQRGECQIRTPAGFLVADVVRREDNTISIIALPPWQAQIEALA